MKTRLLANAQFFGYAPTSLMLAVLEKLVQEYTNEYDITLINSPHIEALLRRVNHNYHIVDIDDEHMLSYLNRIDAHDKFDVFYSSYDPTLMAYAWYYNKPRILYDGLFQFWDNDGFEDTINEDLARMAALRDRRDYEGFITHHDKIWNKNAHQMIFSGHIFADMQFVRKNPTNKEKIKKYKHLVGDIREIDAIVNARGLTKLPYGHRDTITVSLGGSLNPIVPLRDNIRYAQLVIDLCNNILTQTDLSSYKWQFVCHPAIHQRLKLRNIKTTLNIRSGLTQLEYFDILRSSIAAFVPPSYTAMQEAAYFDVPVYLLPEQNGGQPHCVSVLKANGYNCTFNATLYLHHGLFFKEFEINSMYAALDKLHSELIDNETYNSELRAFARIINNVTSFEKLLTSQQVPLRSMIGSFNGVDDITRHIHSYIRR